MPAPISAGVFGMRAPCARTRPASATDLPRRMPAAMLITRLALSFRPEQARRLAHLLRLDGEHHDVARAQRPARSSTALRTPVLRGQAPRARRRSRPRRAAGPRRIRSCEQAADQRTRHVAAADEHQFIATFTPRALSCAGRRRSRCRCAPWWSLRRRRPPGRRDMPIESVSSRIRPSGLRTGPRSSRKRARACVAGLRDRHQPAQPQIAAMLATAFASAERLRGRDAALARFPRHIHLDQHVERRGAGRALLGQAARDLLAARRDAPSRSARRRRASCCSGAGR